MRLDDFGPVEKLHAAIRRRAPQVAASITRDHETGKRQVRVIYRHAGPVTVQWDGAAYRSRRGNGPWSGLPADPEDAADTVAADLGAAPRQ